MMQKAPFFNRIKMYRKFKGNALFGANTLPAPGQPRGPPRPLQRLPSGPPRGGPSVSHYGPPPTGGYPRPGGGNPSYQYR